MEGEKKVSLFREKSLEAIESPESLNDYLRVTSAGVWLVLAAVIALLAGLILWGIFGEINTEVSLAVYSAEGKAECDVPLSDLGAVIESGTVTVEGEEYGLDPDANPDVVTVSESMNPFLLLAGNLTIGDTAVAVPLKTAPPEGVYTGTAVTGRLRPISLLLSP